MSEFSILTINIERSGLVSPRGEHEDRLLPQAELIRDTGAAIVCVQEAHRWSHGWHRHATQVGRATGLQLMWKSLDGGSTALLYDPQQVELTGWEHRHGPGNQGFSGVALFAIGQIELALACVHLAPEDPKLRESQMRGIIRRVLRGVGLTNGAGAVVGDFNSHPLPHPLDPQEVDPQEVDPADLDPLTVMGSTITLPDGTTVWDRVPAYALREAKFLDVVHLLVRGEGDRSLLAPTYRNGGTRLDQTWVTKGLSEAVVGYELVENQHSDHDAALTTFDLSRLGNAA